MNIHYIRRLRERLAIARRKKKEALKEVDQHKFDKAQDEIRTVRGLMKQWNSKFGEVLS